MSHDLLQIAVNFWAECPELAVGESSSDTHSLGEVSVRKCTSKLQSVLPFRVQGLEDSYFSPEEVLPEIPPEGTGNVLPRPRLPMPDPAAAPSAIAVKSCLALQDGPSVPLMSLVQVGPASGVC